MSVGKEGLMEAIGGSEQEFLKNSCDEIIYGSNLREVIKIRDYYNCKEIYS